ncbi:threonine/homoserine efflux transporter RhtA [Paenibacillus taihuensis]|uniref:Threonine/homoserine efflux transporter RhtA n=1 Tax=Paenibacillus taihuensis TaxID=1156355 RepID=A0A3D9RQX2_9BACL|nr:DMT family transporter [Paenibacillus taihuensis]REE77740.1 threonine/homoserine efflux transporter RhtA [Paenibacillus taihuensis]
MKNNFQYLGLVLLATMLMGIAFPIGKLGLLYAPPFFLMGIRYIMAGGILALIVKRKPLPKSLKQWIQVFIIGLLQSAGVMGCVYYSMQWISSSESAILTFMSPLLVIILSTILLGNHYRFQVWIGVCFGFVGVFLTFGFNMNISTGTIIGFMGAVCFALSTILVKRWGQVFEMQVLTAYQMLSGGIVLIILSLLLEHSYFIFSLNSVFILLFLVILCSIVQFSVWFYLLQKGDPGKTSSFLFLAPFFGVISSWLLLGEQLKWYVGLGGVFIGTGVFLVNWKVTQKQSSN